MTDYIIGVDGGGTKTLAVLYTVDGVEIARCEEGYANFSISINQTQENIKKAIEGVLETDVSVRELYIQIGVAGLSHFRDKEAFIKELEEDYQASVSIENDAMIALYSVKKQTEKSVIMAIGGTGSAIMIQDGEKTILRGGFGHLLGDQGSAYHVVIEAFKSMISEAESTNELSRLSKALLSRINKNNYQEIKDFLYNNDKREIAALSTLIAEYALKGDCMAIDLLKTEAKAIGQGIVNAYKLLENQDDVVIALRGGFLQKAPHVQETVLQILEKELKHFDLETKTNEAVKGAYYLASSKLSVR